MKTIDNLWLFRSGTYTDLTATAISGLALTVQAGDKLYVGQRDWLAGLAFFTTAAASSSIAYITEVFDGDDWRILVPEKAFENERSGFAWDTAWKFQGDGALYWGKIPFHINTAKASNTWPETGTVPSTDTRYWYRITFTTVAGLILSRAYPLPYNTYTNVKDMSSFLSLPEFTETSAPTADHVRNSIRDQEDWLDNYCHRSWRLRAKVADTYDFNPYGLRLRNQPPQEVTRVGLWNGTAFDILGGGRGEQWFLDREKGMLYFTLPSFRLRYYSFLLSRYLRQPASVVVDYLYGEDFETSPNATDVEFIIKRLVGADLVRNNDETGMFSSGLEVLSKGEKVREWAETALDRADNLRWPVMTGLGAATF